MKITEQVMVTKELHVVDCIACGKDNILISDNNYSSFNTGGGKCKDCGHEVNAGVGCMPTITELVNIWNKGNDFEVLIKNQEKIIAQAKQEITRLDQLQIKRLEPKRTGYIKQV